MPQGLKKVAAKPAKISHKPSKLRKGGRVFKSHKARIIEGLKPKQMLSKAINQNIEAECVAKSGKKFRLVKPSGGIKNKNKISTGKLIKQVLQKGRVSL